MLNDKIFKELANTKNETCVSMYIPTHRDGQYEKTRIEFKNALQAAERKLEVINYSENEAKEFLAKAYALADDVDFMKNQSDTLAVFIGENRFETFSLPFEQKGYTFVGNEFYVLPLLEELSSKERFFILAMSQNKVRFFEGRSTAIYPVKIEDLVPESRKEALYYYDDTDAKLQHHSGGSPASPTGGAIFHGQGGGKDVENARLKEYMRAIDSGLMEMLHDEKVPLIIAAVDYLVPIYREISDYKYISEAHIGGNPDEMSPTDLHHAALEELQGHFDSEKNAVLEEFGAYMSENKADTTVVSVVPSAINQKIETLFVTKGHEFYGTVDAATQSVELADEMNSENQELLNVAAKHTYLNGGKVYVLDAAEMPSPTSPVAAIYRYETVNN